MSSDQRSTTRKSLIAGIGAATLLATSAAIAGYTSDEQDHESQMQQFDAEQQHDSMQGFDSNAETAQVPPQQPSWDDWDTDADDDDDDDSGDVYYP